MLDEQDEKKLKKMMVETFNEGLEQVVMPVLNEVLERVESLQEGQHDVLDRLGSIEQRQKQEQGMLDVHDREIETIKKQLPAVA